MRFFDVVTKYELLLCVESTGERFDTDGVVNLEDGEVTLVYGNDSITFESDAAITILPDDSSHFKVKDVDGMEFEFVALNPVDLNNGNLKT